jgi:hypothetical protein
MAEKWDWDREFEDAGTPGHRYARPVNSVLLIFGDGDDDFWRIEGMSDEVVKDIVRLHNADCCLAPAPSREEHRKLAQTIWAGIWDRKINLEGLTQVLADCFPALSRGVCDNMRHSVEPHAFVPEECADWRVEAPAPAPAPGHDETIRALVESNRNNYEGRVKAEAHLARVKRVLLSGFKLVESAFAHVSHGGPTRADAEEWLKCAGEALASDPVATEKRGTI